ncbi:MAG: 3-deoxy-8-phosphooctulonate synthase [Phycisphaeraceae bacterium]|nr:3-deoxy-8-phosphooctulonate synthase [Phycisphaeraceae bacterium]
MTDTRTIQVADVRIGPGAPLAIISGPCVIESRELCLEVGTAMRDRCASLGLGYIFKASFDKANRSSMRSDRGPGPDEGLSILDDVRRALGVPVTTDIHEPAQAERAAGHVDLLQIPAFLSRQTDLLAAAARTGKPVNVKKGQFLSPSEMSHVIGKLEDNGAADAGIVLTERGTFFGYHRLVNDFVGVADMMELGWPVCFDATHSTQAPGQTNVSGGRPERSPQLARCAAALGVHALFLETHPEPAEALSDAASMLPLADAVHVVDVTAKLHAVVTR